MTISIGKSVAEIEVMAVSNESSELDMAEIQLSRYIRERWTIAKFAKQEFTERFLKCERQRRGVYDPERAMEIARTGGSDIFMRLTDIKCRAAQSWIRDVMQSMNDRPFALEPSEEPEIPVEVKMGIIDMVRQEAELFVQSGARIHPEAFRTRLEVVHDQIKLKIKEEAKDAARRMEDKIEDQLAEGNFKNALNDFIDDFVTFPTAILKGPSVRRRKNIKWGSGYLPIVVTDFQREFERVSPYDIFPSPSSSGPNDGYLIQRHRLNRSELQSLRGVPGYSTNQIDQVLERYGDKGFREALASDQERDSLEGKPVHSFYTNELIEALEFWGSAKGETLIEWGMSKKDIEEKKEYDINAWMIGPFVIKAVVNPDPLGKRPYEIASWCHIPGAFWGVALPEQMRDTQIMCNAAARSLANNMAIASGPQVEVSVDRLPDGEDVTSMYPWKIWQTTSDRTGGGQSAIRFYQPGMNSDVLLGVYQSFMRQADEVTGIPNYIYGSGAGGSGAGRTASGLSMLMDNAAKGIKQSIATIDNTIAGVVSRLYIHNMMYDSDQYVKGDFRVVAKGATGFIAREQLQVRRNEFLAATGNQIDLQIVGLEGRAYLLREVARTLQMDTDKLVPDQEVLKFNQEQQQQLAAMQAMQQASQQPAPAELDVVGNPAGGTDANMVTPISMRDGGIVQNKFNADGEGYDYETARRYQMQPDSTGHWGSRVELNDRDRPKNLPDGTGLMLKGSKHETWDKAVTGEQEAGYKIIKQGDRYYSVPVRN